MPVFDAGSISGKATLDRDEFIRGLDELSAKADEFSRKKISPQIDLTGTKQLSAQLDAVKRKLDAMRAVKVKPSIDLSGIAKSEADLTAMRAQLALLDKQKTTVTVDTKQAEGGIKRLLDAALALAPALAPVGAAAVGGALGLAGAFTAAGVGVGAFALAAAPALKKVTAAEGALNTAVQSRTAAQKKALDGLSTSEAGAAKEMLSLVQTYAGFSKVLEPTTFTALAKGADIAKTGLHDIAPIAHTTGLAFIGLEDDLKKALNTQYLKTFFNYLGVEAPRSVSVLGRSVGNLGLGFAGILQAFTPVEHQLESGILNLSQKFARFGQGAGTDSGLQSFIQYVQLEGPKVVHLIGQFGSTFAQVAKDAAPLGAAELKIISGILGFVDAEAKAHPKLIELALGIYTVNKAISALKIGALLTGVGGAVGSASSGKGLLGLGAGLVGLSTGSKKLADVFPRVAKAATGVGTASVGAQLGLLSVGEAVGGGVAAGVGLVSGLGLLVGGLIAVQAHFSQGKQTADQYAASIAKAAGVTAPSGTNNTANLFAYNDAITAEGNARNRAAQGRNAALLTAGGASDVTGAQFAEQAIKVKALADAQARLTKTQKATITGDKSMQSSLKALGPDFDLTGNATAALADKLGINLAAGFTTSAKMSDKQKVAVADNVSKLKEYEAEIRQSHDPTARFAADIKQAGDATQTADQQVSALTAALTDYQALTTGVATSSAQAGDALAAMAHDFSRTTTAAGKNSAAQRILTGDLLQAGPQTRKLAEDLSGLQSGFNGNLEAMFKTAVESGHTAQGFAEVKKQAGLNRTALIRQLEAMGLNATEAKRLADKYAAIPKDISTKVKFDDIKARQTVAGFTTDVQAHLDALASKPFEIQLNGSVGSTLGEFGSHAIANAAGGYQRGPGTGTSDSIPSWLSNGEYVINAKSTAQHRPLLDAINYGATPAFAAGGIVGADPTVTVAANMPTSAMESLLDRGANKIRSAFASMISYHAGAGVAQWAPTILKALTLMHQPSSLLGTVERRMNQESGGNPKAINLTDINAQNGDPSRGLMQTIGSTFRAYHFPGTSSNIYDPLANILASMRYALSRYGSLAAAYNKTGGYASGGSPRTGEIAWVGEQGPELVRFNGPATVYKHSDSMKMAGAGLPGYAAGGKVMPGTTFKSSKLFEQAGSHLLDVILGSLTGSRATSTIKSVTDNLIRSIDKDFTGSAKSGLVGYTQRVNDQMTGLAKQRDAIAAKISAANEVSTSVTSAAKSSADITSLTATGTASITRQFNSRLASITNFSKNIATLKNRGVSAELLTELTNAGIDQGAPMAEKLVKATGGQIHSLNLTQRAIDRASTKLGTVAVNAQFGNNAANSFVAQLKTQEHSLESQMAQLAKVFAHGVGKAFHIKGYAAGGHPSAGELAVVGERGPELVQFGASATVHPNATVSAGGGDNAAVVAAVTANVAALLVNARFAMDRAGWRIVAKNVTEANMRIPA